MVPNIYRDLPTLGYLVNVSMLKLNVGMSTFFFSLRGNTENTFTESMLVLIRFPVADNFYSYKSKLQKTFRNLFDDDYYLALFIWYNLVSKFSWNAIECLFKLTRKTQNKICYLFLCLYRNHQVRFWSPNFVSNFWLSIAYSLFSHDACLCRKNKAEYEHLESFSQLFTLYYIPRGWIICISPQRLRYQNFTTVTKVCFESFVT